MLRKKYLVLVALVVTPVALWLLFQTTPRSFVSTHDINRMTLIPAGTLTKLKMTDSGQRVITKKMDSFYMDIHPVTVVDFKRFVAATNYITSAESFGNSGVFDMKSGEWQLKTGATWRYPLGPEFAKAEDTHPVTQVSWHDANAYAKWAGLRLPTELEWEYAARNAGAIEEHLYPWNSNLVKENDSYKANFWQGVFPLYNNLEDGFKFTSPVGSFGATPLGLQDMAGNVWEWCSDWKETIELNDTRIIAPRSEKVQRGGSFLCDTKVCHGFRLTVNSSSTPDTSLMNVGFRCVKD